jgi:2-succinyl-5-enolpyruvyl-6-hydroxy-3-cyclohexene-1-carboxylate synthase
MRRLKKIVRPLVFFLILCQPIALWAADSGERWRDLSPKEKDAVRRNYQRWQNLPPRDKDRLREEWNRWQNLPPDRRDKLRERYDDLQRRDGKNSRRPKDRDSD